MFTSSELKELEQKGISSEIAEEQLKKFRTGFPYLKVVAPASTSHGMLKLTQAEENNWIHLYEEESQGLDLVKFVPASGAASRMFKNIFELLNTPDDEVRDLMNTQTDLQQVFEKLENFAFYPALFHTIKKYGITAILYKIGRAHV